MTVKQYGAFKKLTAPEVAKDLKISLPVCRKLYQGRSIPKPETIKRIVKRSEKLITFEDLLYPMPNKPSKKKLVA